ncbi:hypothetical protein COO91_01168 [Nostoc flagelliforme CCNUN1]|uniref:Uncharacterized protein n=1 Tax=Nostoc flagelliforme CCNUN1 TaxID=2038116 RepID=A0A2K8SIL6_9NOSO|nr:hypothetical protein COO91_01168 [Nostoc flagelliforme CCNUN1]
MFVYLTPSEILTGVVLGHGWVLYTNFFLATDIPRVIP